MSDLERGAALILRILADGLELTKSMPTPDLLRAMADGLEKVPNPITSEELANAMLEALRRRTE